MYKCNSSVAVIIVISVINHNFKAHCNVRSAHSTVQYQTVAKSVN